MARRVHSIADELLAQSRDSALAAIQVFNNPLARFRSEAFIVLMNIAWTYLLHAYYRKQGIEYRYFRKTPKSRRFERTKAGGYRYWDLTKCLDATECPLDKATRANLRFLIGLRDEITHHMSPALDDYVSGRYQACAINYNNYARSLFGEGHGIDQHLTYSLQLQGISHEQIATPAKAPDLPPSVLAYISKFDETVPKDDFDSNRFSYRVIFVPKLAGKPGQADEVVEFVKADSDLAEVVNRAYVEIKEVERPKFLPGQIVKMMQEEGFTGFNMHHHTTLWQALDARKEGKGYGTLVANAWYWYERWVDVVREHCREHAPDYVPANST